MCLRPGVVLLLCWKDREVDPRRIIAQKCTARDRAIAGIALDMSVAIAVDVVRLQTKPVTICRELGVDKVVFLVLAALAVAIALAIADQYNRMLAPDREWPNPISSQLDDDWNMPVDQVAQHRLGVRHTQRAEMRAKSMTFDQPAGHKRGRTAHTSKDITPEPDPGFSHELVFGKRLA